jgi:hypothetical protein
MSVEEGTVQCDGMAHEVELPFAIPVACRNDDLFQLLIKRGRVTDGSVLILRLRVTAFPNRPAGGIFDATFDPTTHQGRSDWARR